MKTVRLAVAAALVALFAFVATSPAQAYPVVTVTVTDDTLIGGGTATITATVHPPINCDWEMTYLGQTATGSGTSITADFDTRVVSHTEHDPVFATCTYDDTELPSGAPAAGGSAGSLGTSLVAATQTATGEGTITLLPRHRHHHHHGHGNGGGILPNTGGERLAWLVIGGLLVLVGGGVVVASRRRDA
jgi:LPXTG-motif cell wall-anchored protein